MNNYVVKLKINDDWCYSNWNCIFNTKQLLDGNLITKKNFLLPRRDAQKLMAHLIKNKPGLSIISVVKTTNYEPYVDYEVIQHRSLEE